MSLPTELADLIKQPNSENCFICGVKNVAGAHVQFYEQHRGEPGPVTGEVIARFTGRAEHQGYPGRMHGGIITGILDETIGRAVDIGQGEKPGTWGVTAELTVRFKKPVPLGVELTAKGRITRDIHFLFEGEGEIYLPDGQIAATAFGKYVRLKLDSITANDPVVAQEQLGWRIYADE